MFYTLLKLSEKKIIFSFTINLCIRTPACVRQHKKERSVCFFSVCVCIFVGCIFQCFCLFLCMNEIGFFLQERPSKERSLLMNE